MHCFRLDKIIFAILNLHWRIWEVKETSPIPNFPHFCRLFFKLSFCVFIILLAKTWVVDVSNLILFVWIWNWARSSTWINTVSAFYVFSLICKFRCPLKIHQIHFWKRNPRPPTDTTQSGWITFSTKDAQTLNKHHKSSEFSASVRARTVGVFFKWGMTH